MCKNTWWLRIGRCQELLEFLSWAPLIVMPLTEKVNCKRDRIGCKGKFNFLTSVHWVEVCSRS